MTREIDIAERQALAREYDWPDDFHQETTWNVCGECLKVFQGLPSRIKCRACAERKSL